MRGAVLEKEDVVVLDGEDFAVQESDDIWEKDDEFDFGNAWERSFMEGVTQAAEEFCSAAEED